ncbi:MAG: tetratricopeptide repeat protein [Acidobacteria bacterium]|nr:tetratricopeptide repeat protein [Acidobacteriota bacterium]
MKTLLTLIATTLLYATLGWSQVEVAVVLPFDNESPDAKLDWVSESFVEVLSTHLNTSRLLAVDRRERATAFDTLGIPSARILSNATIYKVAEILDTDRVVLGSFKYEDGLLSASAQVLTMTGPTLSKSFAEQGPLASLLEIQTALAWQIQKHLQPEYPYSKEEYIADRGSLGNIKLEAFENYIRGLMAKDRVPQIQLFRTADRIDPRFTKPAFELGLLYFHDRDYPTSILWLAKLRRSDPDYLEANYFLGLAYLYQGQYERSAAAFRVVETNLPLNEVYNNLGIALARRDQPGAIQYFEKAHLSDPADADYQLNLGFAYWKRGECASAVEHLGPSVDKLNLAAGRAIYADCLKQLGREAEANAELSRLPATYNVAETSRLANLERPKDKHDAVSFRQLTRLMQIQEELQHSKFSTGVHAELHFKKAMEDAVSGLEQEAIEQLHSVLDYDPQDSRAYRELARIHLKAIRLDDAARAAGRALQWNKSAENYILLAQIQIQQGHKPEAMASAEAALGLDPSSRVASEMVSTLQAETGTSTSNR